MALIIGIDPSTTSTGICVWSTDINVNKYFNIVKNPTKKLKNFSSNHINVLWYESPSTKDMSSEEKELQKSKDVQKIIKYIDNILSVFKPDDVVIEAIAMGAKGRIDQLAGLNYAIRLKALEHGARLHVLTPQMIKKEFVGNGAAGKDEMVIGWRGCDTNSQDYKDFQKNSEDLADAYAICHYPKLQKEP